MPSGHEKKHLFKKAFKSDSRRKTTIADCCNDNGHEYSSLRTCLPVEAITHDLPLYNNTSCDFCGSLKSQVEFSTVGIAFNNDVCLDHSGPTDHPEHPRRLQALLKLIQSQHYCHRFYRIASRYATIHEIVLIHSTSHWARIQQLSDASVYNPVPFSTDSVHMMNPDKQLFLSFGGDGYYCESTAKAAAVSLGTTLNLIDTIMDESTPIITGFSITRPPGHHAGKNDSMGFCFLNNVAVAAKKLKLAYGLSRIMIIDIDVHHGNGTQDVLCKDPSFLYISMHRYDHGTYYPKTGSIENKGIAAGKGYSINIPLLKGYTNSELYIIIRDIVYPIASQYKPEFILVSAGFDAAEGDPIGLCHITSQFYGWITRQIQRLAYHYCKGRSAFILEGGYNPEILSECVDNCLTSLGHISLNYQSLDYKLSSSIYLYVERYPSIELLATVGQLFLPIDRHILLAVIDETTYLIKQYFTQEDTLEPYHSSHSYDVLTTLHIDGRYDILSQLPLQQLCECYSDISFDQKMFTITCPLVCCNKLTQQILLNVQHHHQTAPLYLPKLLPFPIKLRLGSVPSHMCYNWNHDAIQLITDKQKPPIVNDHLSEHTPHHDISIDMTENHTIHAYLQSFNTVGGHPNQWFVSRFTQYGFILKATSCMEATFYYWIGTTHGKPFVQHDLFKHPRLSTDRILTEFINQIPSIPMMNDADECIQTLQTFIPFCSSIGISIDRDIKRQFYVEMENLLLHMKTPCIMDVKIGVRMYGDNATEHKKERMIKKAQESTAQSYGIRFTASRVWNIEHCKEIEITRQEGSQFKYLNDLQYAIYSYLEAAPFDDRIDIAAEFLKQLQTLYSWFKSQTICHFYSSSLLFIYDSSSYSYKKVKPSHAVKLRMIDFAHITFNPNSYDTGHFLNILSTLLSLYIIGYIYGLETLLYIVKLFIINHCIRSSISKL